MPDAINVWTTVTLLEARIEYDRMSCFTTIIFARPLAEDELTLLLHWPNGS